MSHIQHTWGFSQFDSLVDKKEGQTLKSQIILHKLSLLDSISRSII